MIKSTKAISMAEAKEFARKKDEEFNSFAKNFLLLKPEKAKSLRENLLALGLIKLNEKHISKIIDILPEDKEELSKIVNDTSLDENETAKILETIKQFR